MKHWKVSLSADIIVYLQAPDDWDDERGLGDMAKDSISLSYIGEEIEAEIEWLHVEDVVEVDKEAS